MRILSDGGEWHITLTDGNVVRLWADGYETTEDHHEFGMLVDTEGAVAVPVRVTNRTPSDPNRVVVSVGRFPIAAVAKIEGG